MSSCSYVQVGEPFLLFVRRSAAFVCLPLFDVDQLFPNMKWELATSQEGRWETGKFYKAVGV
jgi:hypothetical protein